MRYLVIIIIVALALLALAPAYTYLGEWLKGMLSKSTKRRAK